MQVQRIQNNHYQTFGAGTVKLTGIEPSGISTYDAIKKLAQNCDIDISIIKTGTSKYLPKHDAFNVIAKYVSGKNEMPKHGFKCLLVDKKASLEELSTKLYGKVLESVTALAISIKECTGKMPDFIKIVN